MEQIKIKIDYLKQLSNNYFTAILLINSGIAGLFLYNTDNMLKLFILLIIGIYFDCVCILRFQSINCKISNLIEGIR